MWILQLRIAAFASFVDVVWLGTELQRKLFRSGHVMRLHQFLLLSRPRLASGKRLLEYWGRCRSDWSPFVKLLTKEVSFETQKNLCPLDLSKIKALCCHFFRVGHHWIDVRPHEVSKCFCSSNNVLQYFFFLGLKGQVRDLSLPVLKVFKLGTSCITRDLDAIVADRASVIVIFFDLATGNFEALSMVPMGKSGNVRLNEHSVAHHS